MRQHDFASFKEDVRSGLPSELLEELYDLTPEETKRGIKYVNRSWLECLISGLVQFFRKLVFEIQMNIKTFKIKQISREVKKNVK